MLHKTQKNSHIKETTLVAILVIVAVLASIPFAVLRFAEAQQQNDIRNWQARLGIIADSRQQEINGWLQRQFNALQSLSENASLQLYMTELSNHQGQRENITDEPFQATYLRNLLDITSERTGFNNEVNSSQNRVNANVQPIGASGMALLDTTFNIVVSTSLMPPMNDAITAMLEGFSTSSRKRAVSDVYLNHDNQPTVAFMVPVYAVQEQTTTAQPVGTIIGIKPLDDSLFPLLEQPGTIEKSLETLLVSLSQQGNALLYISPVKGQAVPLSKRVSVQDPQSATVFATQNTGQFSFKKDYQLNNVLVTGRHLSYAPWTLVLKINRDEALAQSDARRDNLLVSSLLFVVMLAATLFGIWRHSSYLRESKSAIRFKQLAHDFEAQKNLLSLIADHKPEAVFIVDSKNKVCFANIQAAQEAQMPNKNMVGKTLTTIYGKGRMGEYTKLNNQASDSQEIISQTHRFTDEGECKRIIQSRHIPLEHIPEFEDKDAKGGVLIIEQDITEAILDKEKFVSTLNGLVETLVTIMDKRDEYTANHSSRVASLARYIAQEAGLENDLVETAEIAGRLMNLGRMMIPLKILNKVGELTEKEKQILDNVRNSSANLLEGIEFNGPVIDTIRQSQEKWDGTGPLSLAEDNILITARIVKVANAFISMRSPRAYRLLRTLDDALKIISNESGTEYDKAVVAALIHYMENRGGRQTWKEPEEIKPIWVANSA